MRQNIGSTRFRCCLPFVFRPEGRRGGVWTRSFSSHIERQIELQIRAGLSPEEARNAALRAVGRDRANQRGMSRNGVK